MIREKLIFHIEKYNFEPIGNSVYTTKYLAFGKDLLARLYLADIICNKFHALNEVILFGFLHFQDSSDLENLPLLNIELILILQFCSLDDLLKLCFLTRCLSVFTTIDEKKEEQNSTLPIFLKGVTGRKNLEIHKHN